jgi:pimeloyl-ACP methyl ester carboxylesterase
VDACIAFDIHEKTAQISRPALVLCGKEDAFISNELAWKVYHSIKGAKWLIMPGVGHNLIIPDNVPALTRVVLDFLAAQAIFFETPA